MGFRVPDIHQVPDQPNGQIIGLPVHDVAWIGMLPRRFARKFRIMPDGCWVWMFGKSTDGYGRVWWGGETQPAHRVAYELCVGPIPAGLQIDHLCRNRVCVNPGHLEAVTCRINLLRGQTLQAANAAKTHCVHGHPFAGDNLYERNGRRHCRACRRANSRAKPASGKQ